MPTIAKRSESAARVARSLLRQVDLLVVHLNGYSQTPEWSKHPKVLAIPHNPSRGPLCRYDEIPRASFVITVDDDLNYPSDYVAKTIKHLRFLGRGSLVSYHCYRWPPNETMFEKREIVPFFGACRNYQASSYLGSGVAGFFGDDLARVGSPDRDSSTFERFDDVWISAAIHRSGLKLYRPPSSKGWISAQPENNDGLFHADAANGFEMRKAAIRQARQGGWPLTPSHHSIAGFIDG